HESLPVIVRHANEGDAKLRLATQRPGRVAGQEVDLPGTQRLEAVAGRKRGVVDFLRVTENRGCDCAAEVNVEDGPLAIFPRGRKAEQSLAHAAVQPSALLDRIEGGRRGGGNYGCPR